MKTNLFFLSVAALLAYLVLRPLLPAGTWYPLHDSTHPTRLVLMHETVAGGQFPPLWASGANNGYGWPLFQFYAPLFHLLSTLIGWSLPPLLALKITLFLTLVAGALGTMLFARRFGKVSAVVASVAFLFSPFIALEIYVRGAYSELLSLCLLPWALFTTELLSTPRRIAWASFTLTLFILSHNLIPILGLPLILAWSLYHNKERLRQVAVTILLTIALSAWFTIPLVFERHFTLTDSVARTTSYGLHFVEPWQLWNSTWGFGGSTLGTEDGMSFKLGKLQIILGLLGAGAALLTKRKALILLSICAILFTYLATPYSRIIWDQLPLLQLVQFPWRSLGLVVVLLSQLTGYAVRQLPSQGLRWIVGLVLVFALWHLGSKYFLPQSYLANWGSTQDVSDIVPEFRPVWMPTTPPSPASPVPSTVSGPATLTVDRAYYPTWQASLDNVPIKLSPSRTGLIEIEVPTGLHSFKLWQSHTTIDYFAYALTLLSFGYWWGLMRRGV